MTGIKRLRAPISETLPSTPEVVDFVAEKEAEEDYDAIGVDAAGLGRGALDYLQTMPFAHKVFPFIANARASREWEDKETKYMAEKLYANYKTRIAYEMRRDAFRGNIRIPPHPLLKDQLLGYKLMRVNSRWKLVDPKPSPDLGDAAIIGLSLVDEASNFWVGS